MRSPTGWTRASSPRATARRAGRAAPRGCGLSTRRRPCGPGRRRLEPGREAGGAIRAPAPPYIPLRRHHLVLLVEGIAVLDPDFFSVPQRAKAHSLQPRHHLLVIKHPVEHAVAETALPVVEVE